MQHNFYKTTFQQYALQTEIKIQPHNIKWSATPTDPQSNHRSWELKCKHKHTKSSTNANISTQSPVHPCQGCEDESGWKTRDTSHDIHTGMYWNTLWCILTRSSCNHTQLRLTAHVGPMYACQVRVTVGNSGLCCCTCITYYKHWLTPLCVDPVHVHWEWDLPCDHESRNTTAPLDLVCI